MKKLVLTCLAAIALHSVSFCQTNTFPTASGNAGIGTTSPTHQLTLATGGSLPGIAWYNTTDQTTNYERTLSQWLSNTFTIGTYFGGTGTFGRALSFGVATSANSALNRLFTINQAATVASGIYNFSSSTSGLGSMVTLNTGLIATSGQQNMLAIQGGITQGGTAGYTALLIAPYESTTGSGSKYLIDAGTNSGGGGGGTHTSMMVLTDAGNLGIGTANPPAKLTLAGTGSLNPNTGPEIDYAGENLTFRIESGGYSGNSGTIKMVQATGAYLDHADMVFLTAPGGGSNTEKLRITGGGNIGIGATVPAAKLTVSGSGTTSNLGAPAIADLYGTFDRTRLTIGNSTVTTGGTRSSAITFYGMNAVGTAYKGNWEIGNDLSTNGTNDFYIYNADLNSEPLYISSTGNIGVGITNPTNKLDVNGTIHSKQVNVDLTGWSDFVFKKSYRLPSLADVKTYIDKNRHLPDVPSEQEIVKDGLNLGEMNKLLMKKVEELTLYLIEKDKENKAQAQQIKNIETRLNALTAKLKNPKSR